MRVLQRLALAASAAAAVTGLALPSPGLFAGKATGTECLSADALARASASKQKFEKMKMAKDGALAWTEVHEFAADLKAGKYTWDEIDGDDLNLRLKWAGFFTRKATPGKLMVRLKIPNGVVSADALRYSADALAKHDDGKGDSCADITTRMNLQLRGIPLDDATEVMQALHGLGLTTLQSGMDNLRNVVGSPLAGIDPHEQIDTLPVCIAINDMHTGDRCGNPEFANLPRKINVAVSGSRDDFAHTQANDIGLEPAQHAETGEWGFNIVLGGFFSIKRTAISVPVDVWCRADAATVLVRAILTIFRDHGARENRQATRLMYLVDDWGVEKMADAIKAQTLEFDEAAVLAGTQHPADDQGSFERRDILGVHPQRQEGYSWAGVCVPAGRLTIEDMRQLARLSEEYGRGELRLTVEQNIVIPHIPNDRVAALSEDLLWATSAMSLAPGPLMRGLVSCTGAQFCPVAIIETKNRALEVTRLLEERLEVPSMVRMHWTGCPNSCGVPQIADIGMMGAPAKKVDPETGKKMAVSGCNIFAGGTIGEGAGFGDIESKAVPTEIEDIVPALAEMLVANHGASYRKEWTRKSV